MEKLIITHFNPPTFLKVDLFFNWRIIALQNFVIFCQMSTWINHRCTYVPSVSNLPPVSFPIPPLPASTEPLLELPETQSNFPLATYLTYGNIHFHGALSIHLTLSFSPLQCVHKSVFYVYFSIVSLQINLLSKHLLLPGNKNYGKIHVWST